MKKKISISINENILQKIDKDVKELKGKNRSQVIENIINEKYGEYVNTSAIIFAHDYKWDDGEYPFYIPKSLITVGKESIIFQQIKMLVDLGVKSIYISIPPNTKNIFKKELSGTFADIDLTYTELPPNYKTGEVLKSIIVKKGIGDILIIMNGDLYFGSLQLKDYYEYHFSQNSDFSFLLRFTPDSSKLGNVRISGNKVIGFEEKPKKNMLMLINAGLYITTKKFLLKNSFGNYIEYDFFPRLPSLGNTVGYIYNGEWIHMQNNKSYEISKNIE